MLRKILKIVAWTGVLLVLLLFGAAIALQTRGVQTALAKKATQMLAGKFDADIRVERIHLRLFDAAVIHGITVLDAHPYDQTAPVDTFFSANTVSATFSVMGLLRGEGIHFREVRVSDANMALTIEPGPTTNIQRIFHLVYKPYEPSDAKLFDISRVSVDGMRFRMLSYTSPSPSQKGSINWGDLDIRDIRVRGRTLAMRGHVMTGIADEVSFREKSGYVARNVSGSVSAGDGVTRIENLRIVDKWSDLDIPLLQMSYKIGEGFGDFIEDVTLDGNIRPSSLDFTSLGFFASALQKMNLKASVQGSVHGPVADLNLSKIQISEKNSGFKGTVSGSLTGLPDAYSMVMDATLKDSEFTLAQLSDFIRGIVPTVNLPLEKFARGETFHFDGTVKGTLNRLAVTGDARSAVGDLRADLLLRDMVDNARPLVIGGSISTDDLDAGKIADIKQLGPVTMRANLEATLADGGPTLRLDSLFVDRLNALSYDYTGIAATGSYSGDAFDGRLVCSDPNLNFLFQGLFSLSRKTRNSVYQFYANLGHADLHALKLDPRGTSRIQFQTRANFRRSEDDEITGDVTVGSLRLEDSRGVHDIGDIGISSSITNDRSNIRLESSFLEGRYTGSKFITGFISDLQDLTVRKELPAVFGEPKGEHDGSRYNLSLLTHDTRDITSFFIPGLYLADSTSLRLSVSEEGLLKGRVKSKRIAIKDKYLKGLNLSLSNADGSLTGELDSDQMNISPIQTLTNRLLVYAQNNRLGLGYSFDNNTEAANRGELFLTGGLARGENGKLAMDADILSSNLYFNGDAWSIFPAGLAVSDGRVSVDSLRLASDDQSILIDGDYSPQNKEAIALNLKNFDIGIINSLIGGDYDFQGRATGRAVLTSPLADRIDLGAGLSVEDAAIAGHPVGTLLLRSSWNEDGHGFNFDFSNRLDAQQTFLLSGLFVPKSKTLDASARLRGFNLGYAAPALESVFSEMAGTASGDITIKGPMDALDIASNRLRIENGLLRVAFTNVAYNVDGPVTIGNDGVRFDNIAISDRFGEKGTVTGSLGWNHFKDMSFDTHIHFRDMEAYNLSEKDGQLFYGNAFATGRVDVTGPLNAIKLNVMAATAKQGEFHLPLRSAVSSSSDLLTFVEPETAPEIDPYEEMMGNLIKEESSSSQLGVHVAIDVDQGTQALIEIDKSTGNILTGRGSGRIELDVTPGDWSIGGNYNISSGNYHFEALGIARKDFAIQDGSGIRFSGDVMESDLDIKAVYRTKAAIGTLISDTTTISRRNVDCIINISDKLRNPRVSFDINIPDLDPSTQNQVENALNTTDKVQKQFLSLLISGSFLPDEQSGIVNNTNLLNTTVSEMMSSQINQIFKKFDIPLDIGMDYQTNESGRSIYDLAVSTELFNNRVVVNGTIGNRSYESGNYSSEVVGDLDIEVKLDKSGALRLKLFSHSADQFTSYLDNTQRNGIGLSYQREFNTFSEFFRAMFRSKERRQEEEAARLRAIQNEDRLRMSIRRDEDEDELR